MSVPGVAERVAVAIAREQLLVPAGDVVAMVSGGADSTLLVVLLAELGYRVRALHVAHRQRGAASAADEEAVAGLCRRLGVPLTVVDGTVRPGSNLESRLRDVRLAAAVAEAGADPVATGHTASDRAETILYRLATSGGVMALPALPARDGARVRPLIDLDRADVREELRRRAVPWREDASNGDPRHARNRIRAEVLPVLVALNPAADRNIARAGRLAADERDLVDSIAARLVSFDGSIDLAALQHEHVAVQRAAIRLAAHAAGVRPGYTDVEALRALRCTGSELRSLPGETFAERRGSRLAFHRQRP
jgi:tRNA(Ile)-lysidine synthase